MHYYQFNIGDYQSHTSHLDDLEDLAYRRLLDWVYLHEKPLPFDIQEIAKFIRMRTECERIANVLREFFIEGKDGYSHARVSKEITLYRGKSKKASNSAKSRWAKQRNGSQGDANALRTQCEGNAKQEPINIKHKPRNKNQYINALAQSADSFDWFWSAYPKKKSKGQAEKIWSKLNPDSELVEKILSALDTAKRSNDWMKDGGQFIPYPSTWLNAKGWEDEIYQQTAPILSNYQNVAVFERFLNSGERE